MSFKGIVKEQLIINTPLPIDLNKNSCTKCNYISFTLFKCDNCGFVLCGNCYKTYKCQECETGLIYELRTDLFKILKKENIMIKCIYCQDKKTPDEIESHQNFCQKNLDFISSQSKFDNIDSSDSIVISLDGDNFNEEEEKNKFVIKKEKLHRGTNSNENNTSASLRKKHLKTGKAFIMKKFSESGKMITNKLSKVEEEIKEYYTSIFTEIKELRNKFNYSENNHFEIPSDNNIIHNKNPSFLRSKYGKVMIMICVLVLISMFFLFRILHIPSNPDNTKDTLNNLSNNFTWIIENKLKNVREDILSIKQEMKEISNLLMKSHNPNILQKHLSNINNLSLDNKKDFSFGVNSQMKKTILGKVINKRSKNDTTLQFNNINFTNHKYTLKEVITTNIIKIYSVVNSNNSHLVFALTNISSLILFDITSKKEIKVLKQNFDPDSLVSFSYVNDSNKNNDIYLLISTKNKVDVYNHKSNYSLLISITNNDSPVVNANLIYSDQTKTGVDFHVILLINSFIIVKSVKQGHIVSSHRLERSHISDLKYYPFNNDHYFIESNISKFEISVFNEKNYSLSHVFQINVTDNNTKIFLNEGNSKFSFMYGNILIVDKNHTINLKLPEDFTPIILKDNKLFGTYQKSFSAFDLFEAKLDNIPLRKRLIDVLYFVQNNQKEALICLDDTSKINILEL